MKQSATSRITLGEAGDAPPRLDPAPASAEDEAMALLRIAAEVEGAMVAQYLFSAASLIPGISVQVPGSDHRVQSDDWYDLIRLMAKQEMGHLVTVQNLLLSLGAAPHLDRENFPSTSPLYPFPFSLQPVRLSSIARFVGAEAPRAIPAADQADYADAVREAKTGDTGVVRAGQIYERLFYLLQDGDAPQDPWRDLQNPFPDWPAWHVDPGRIGLNQDRQATPAEWRGQGDEEAADTAIYVLQVQDKVSARKALYAIAVQGEGPVGDAETTHFDKFLRIFREFRAVAAQANAPSFVRNQADDPRTGATGSATISNPATSTWAKLANARYQMLLTDIALSLSIGSTGMVPATQATRRDFQGWAFREMLASIKPLAEELRQMPLGTDAATSLAGLPFELPAQALPTDVAAQVEYLREHLDVSKQLRAQIAASFKPNPRQQGLLKVMDNLDTVIGRRFAAAVA